MFTNNLYTCFDTTNSNMYFVNKIKYQITMNISLTAIEMLSFDRNVFLIYINHVLNHWFHI